MYILGISNGHVATAILLKDGSVIACASEERFNGIKNYNGFPRQAIEWCLQSQGLSGSDIDLVTTPYLYRPPVNMPVEQRGSSFALVFVGSLAKSVEIFRQGFRGLRYSFPAIRGIGMVLYRLASSTVGSLYTKKQKEYVTNLLHIPADRFIAYEHHLSHAAAAYYASPFNTQKALVFTLDGEGDNFCASVNIFEGTKYTVLAKTPREYSMGYIYGWVTKFLGMKPHEHEYKVMGLAPYAKDEDVLRVYKKIEHVITLDPDNPLRFYMPLNAQDFSRFLDEHMHNIRFDHLAGAFQKLVEDRTIEWVQAAIKKTGIHTVILSGGVFMNVKANQKIAALSEVKKFYILPSCADESAPLGSSYLGYRQIALAKNTPFAVEPITDVYWGSEVSRDELEKFIVKIKKRKDIKITKLKTPEKTIASLLVKNFVVAHLSGRMEFGARALGNRSLLANASNPMIVREINMKMKNRDFWMPFAPTILWERMKDYVINKKNILSPYMMISFDSTLRARKELMAAMHAYDYTLRPQLLTQEANPRYYKIIKAFEALTGMGGILNTSFNLHGYPIVRGPTEAFYAFEHSGLTHLVIENFLIEKRAKPSHAKRKN